MTNINKTTLIVGSAIAIIILATALWLTQINTVFGNVAQVTPACRTATATTSVTYITAGTATTTLICDFYADGTNPTLANGGMLKIQFMGSSTASTLDTYLEYSQDGEDYYESAISDKASTSPTKSLGTVQAFSFTFASSTAGHIALANASSTRATRITKIDTPTRFVKAVFVMPVGSTPGAFWAEVQGIKER